MGFSFASGLAANNWDYTRPITSDNLFFRDYQFLNGEAGYQVRNDTIDFYLSLLAADITEDMLFSSPKGQYQMIENGTASYQFTLTPENWCAAVYSGRYGFAADILSTSVGNFNEFRGFEQILMSENADFIDLVTDNGSNENYIKIMLNILVQDYLRGGRSIFEYVKRYCPNKNLSDEEYLDQALLSLNDPDRLYKEICSETEYILDESDKQDFLDKFDYVKKHHPNKNLSDKEYLHQTVLILNSHNELYKTIFNETEIPDKKNSCVFADEYNRLAAKLMCRCAELGMRLKSFVSFKYMFIFSRGLYRSFNSYQNFKRIENEYDFEDNNTEDFYDEDCGFKEDYAPEADENTDIEQMEIPNQLADLIDGKTSVCGINYADLESYVDCYRSHFMPVYFHNNTSGASEPFEELEYIAVKFKERFGYMLKLKAEPNDLKNLDGRYAGIIELDISQQAITKICNNKKLLKIILKNNILSKDNIEALIKCCTEAIARNKNKNAIITLQVLSNALDKTNI